MTSEISVLSNGSLFNHSSDGGHSFDIADARHDSLPNRKLSHHPLLGMILVTLSAILYAVLNISVKLLMHSTPWQELMFIRMAITWCSTMVWMLAQYRGRISFFGPAQHRLLLVIRGVFLWGAMFACWWSFEFLPVGDGTTLAMSFPVWVSLFAHFFMSGEDRLDIFGWLCVFAGLCGITFVAQPTFLFGGGAGSSYGHRDIGLVIAISSAVCAGAQYVIVNYTKRDCHWLQVEQVTSSLSTFLLCPLAAVAFAVYDWTQTGNFFIEFETLSAERWMEEIGLGLLGFVALALLTRGSQLDAPARTAICLYLEIPFVYIGQCAMTKELPNVFVFVGIFLVLGSVVIPAVRRLRASRMERERQKMERMRTRKEVEEEEEENECDDGEEDVDGGEAQPLLDNRVDRQRL